MSDTFNPVTDDYTFTSDDQVQIPVSFSCAPLSYVSTADLQAALVAQQAVKSVLKVEPSSTLAELNPFSCSYNAVVNPQPGVSAGDLRAAAYAAMNAANQGKIVRSDQVQVGQLSKLVHSLVPDLAPKTSTTVALVALAVMVLVGGIVFLKLTD